MKSLRHFVRLLSNQPSKKYEIVSPAYVSPKTQFTDLPKNISIPPYAQTGIPPQIDPHTSPEKKSDSEMGKKFKCYFYTVWKFQKFSATYILRESNFKVFRSDFT